MTAGVLELFEGVWQGSEEVSPTPWMPGGTSHATIRNVMPFGPTMLIHDAQSARAGAVWFSAHAVFVAEPSGALRLFWFDSFGFAAREAAEGTWDGTDLVFTPRSERGVARHTYTPLAPATFRLLLESSVGGEGMRKILAATYTRTG